MAMYCYNCMKPIGENTGVCPHCGQTPFGVNQAHQLKPGTILQGRYLIGKAIGQGGFGITYIGMDLRLKMRLAIKEYYPNGISNRNIASASTVSITSSEDVYRHGKDRFLLEAQNLARFKGEPGIVGVLNHFEENNTAYIVMDYIDGITLKKWVETKASFEADTCFEMMKPIMDVLEQMHSQSIIHRDISPDNIMKTPKGRLILLDFGAAREVSGDKSISVMLKPCYAPYEQYYDTGKQGPWTDIYALCATMYFCMTGERPNPSPERMIEDHLKRPSELGVEISGAQESALLRGMAPRAGERYQSIPELKRALFDNEKTQIKNDPGKDKGQTELEITKYGGAPGNGNNRTDSSEHNRRKDDVIEYKKNGNGKITKENKSDGNDKPVKWQNIVICLLAAAVIGLALLIVFLKKAEDVPATEESPVIIAEPIQTPIPTPPPTPALAPTGMSTPVPVPTLTPAPVQSEHTAYKPLAAGSNHTLRIYPDGTIFAVGQNQDRRCDVSGWTDIIAAAAGDRHTVGLRANGTVVAVGYDGYDQCDVSGWTDITAVAAGANHTVGLRSDGTVKAVGWTLYGQCNVSGWNNIIAVSAGIGHTVGLHADGTVAAAGDNRYGQCEVAGWSNIIAVAAGNYHTVGLRADGTVVAAGDNRYDRCDVSGWTDIVDIAVGERHTVGLRSDGTVVAVGDNEYRQCDVSSWTDIVSI